MSNDLFSRILMLLALWSGGGLARVMGAETEPLTYYVQLVRGNNEAKAPEPDAHRIGPMLSKQFHSVFKWESYWEITREKIDLVRGQKKRIRLNNQREVEIDLTDSARRNVTFFEGGKPVARSSRPIDEAMTIVGGERDTKSVWFIVVRRDPPPK